MRAQNIIVLAGTTVFYYTMNIKNMAIPNRKLIKLATRVRLPINSDYMHVNTQTVDLQIQQLTNANGENITEIYIK